MRFTALILFALAAGSCTDNADPDPTPPANPGTPTATVCTQSSSCTAQAGGQCWTAVNGKAWCAYPDTACASAHRYATVNVGDNLAGACAPVAPTGSPQEPPDPSGW
jgi:hypothetical protein